MSSLFKKVFLAIVLAVSFSAISCTSLGIPPLAVYLTVDELSNPRDICEWIFWNKDVRIEMPEHYWKDTQHPTVTLRTMRGICSDYTELFRYLVKTKTGVLPEYVGIKISDDEYHILAKIGDTYYDPSVGFISKTLPRGWKVISVREFGPPPKFKY